MSFACDYDIRRDISYRTESDLHPWYAWAAVGEVIAFMVATLITYLIVRKKDKELKEQYE